MSSTAAQPSLTPVPAPTPTPNAQGGVSVNVETPAQQLGQEMAQRQSRFTRTGMKVKDVTVIIGYEGPGGVRQEVMHDINGVNIDKVIHQQEDKKRACKEDGQLVGYEPTGEHVLKLEVHFHE